MKSPFPSPATIVGSDVEAEILPAEMPLTPAQQDQVEQAVRTLNALATRTRLELAVEVSRYILNEFFGGDWLRFTDPRRNKPESFRALTRHRDLLLSRTTLLVLIHVGRQVEAMPGQVARALSVEHHRLLLALPDPQARDAMARLAVHQAWTRQELKTAVQQQLPEKPAPTQAPPKLVAHKRLTGATDSLVKGVTGARVRRELPHWSSVERKRFQNKLEALRTWLQEMEQAVDAASAGDRD